MESLKRKWYYIPSPIRKPLVLIVGAIIVGVGLVMLIFPGPGWAAIFLGFAILATEFPFAKRIQDKLIVLLKWLIDWGLRQLHTSWSNPFA